jgi:hypothetical protein
VPASAPLHRRRRDGFVFWLCFPRLSAAFASEEWVRTAQPRSSTARPSWTKQDPSFFRTGRLWQKEGTVLKIRDGMIKNSFPIRASPIRPHWRKHGHLIPKCNEAAAKPPRQRHQPRRLPAAADQALRSSHVIWLIWLEAQSVLRHFGVAPQAEIMPCNIILTRIPHIA